MPSLVTIERHIIEQQRQYPDATGTFTQILQDMALAAKIIAREARRAGLVNILGTAGSLTPPARCSTSWISSPIRSSSR